MERTRPRLIESHYFYYVQYTGVEWFLLIHIDTIERYYIICTSHITYSRIWNVAAYPRKRSLRSFLSSLRKWLFLRGESVESWKNNRHDCADCSEWRISFSVWYWTTISKKKRKKRKKRNVPRVSITSRIERAIDIWRILSGLETEHPRFAIYATDSTRWKFEAASSFNYRL